MFVFLFHFTSEKIVCFLQTKCVCYLQAHATVTLADIGASGFISALTSSKPLKTVPPLLQ